MPRKIQSKKSITLILKENDLEFRRVEKMDRVTIRSNGSIEWTSLDEKGKAIGEGIVRSGKSINVTVTVTRN